MSKRSYLLAWAKEAYRAALAWLSSILLVPIPSFSHGSVSLPLPERSPMLLPCFPTSSFEPFPLEPLPALKQTYLSLEQMAFCCYCLRSTKMLAVCTTENLHRETRAHNWKRTTYDLLINSSCRLQSIVGAFKMFASSIRLAE